MQNKQCTLLSAKGRGVVVGGVEGYGGFGHFLFAFGFFVCVSFCNFIYVICKKKLFPWTYSFQDNSYLESLYRINMSIRLVFLIKNLRRLVTNLFCYVCMVSQHTLYCLTHYFLYTFLYLLL